MKNNIRVDSFISMKMHRTKYRRKKPIPNCMQMIHITPYHLIIAAPQPTTTTINCKELPMKTPHLQGRKLSKKKAGMKTWLINMKNTRSSSSNRKNSTFNSTNKCRSSSSSKK